MFSINAESIKRVENGDTIVRGDREQILKKNYQDGWYVLNNLRGEEALEVERSGLLTELSATSLVNRRISYGEFIDNDWYLLDPQEII